MEFSGKSCIRQNFGFSGSLLEIPGTPGGVLIFRDFPGKNGRVGQYATILDWIGNVQQSDSYSMGSHELVCQRAFSWSFSASPSPKEALSEIWPMD